nr:hypothetical protein Iba_chr14aCG13820 [Ipomoea batatas]GME02795.1 hypothetical protein Iba_scaffold156.2CG0380 [Ipomoea batatas]
MPSSTAGRSRGKDVVAKYSTKTWPAPYAASRTDSFSSCVPSIIAGRTCCK